MTSQGLQKWTDSPCHIIKQGARRVSGLHPYFYERRNMTKEEIKKLFRDIQALYPFFKNTGADVLAAWERILKDTTYDEAINKLDAYVLCPENIYPPTAGRLATPPKRRVREKSEPEVFWVDRHTLTFHINRFGEIEDEEGRIYVDPDDPYRKYTDVSEIRL